MQEHKTDLSCDGGGDDEREEDSNNNYVGASAAESEVLKKEMSETIHGLFSEHKWRSPSPDPLNLQVERALSSLSSRRLQCSGHCVMCLVTKCQNGREKFPCMDQERKAKVSILWFEKKLTRFPQIFFSLYSYCKRRHWRAYVQ